ncbi:MAG: hypothetical protein ACR2LK_06545 [Solirubrobacteraceae bacterium]
MTELLRHGVLTRSFFEAYGHGEVAATTAVGAVCSQCPGFGASVVEMATGKSAVPISVRLEQHTGEDKRTDIELATADGLVVIEAKVGFDVPTLFQLEEYRERFQRAGERGFLVTLTNVPGRVQAQIGVDLGWAPARHLSWQELRQAARVSAKKARGGQRLLLDELTNYLKDIMRAQDLHSNRVYVVSLGPQKIADTDIYFRDVVLRFNQYIHPAYGKGWPHHAPNYLAFRFDGKLQRISHVQRATVYDLATQNPPGLPPIAGPGRWATDAADRADHVVYELGPTIVPPTPIPTGALYQAAKVWAALDLLLTSPTIADAARLTKQREIDL